MSEISTLPETPVQSPRPVEKIDRVPTGQKAAWGIGAILDNIMANSINMLALQIYNIGLGISPIWIGWGIAIPRIFEAIIDPFLGNLSDNTRSPWGRRRPFMVLGAIISALSFAAVWMPPTVLNKSALSWFQSPIFLFFLISSMFFYLGYALFIIPCNALGIEMSTDYNERTRIQAWKSFFGSVAGFAMPWMYKLALYFGNHFGAGSLSKPEVIGIRFVAVIFGLIVLITGLIPAIYCRERADVQKQEKINIFHALNLTLRNMPFLLLSLVIILILVGIFVVDPFTLYIYMHYVSGGNKDLYATLYAVSGTTYAVMGIVSLPLVTLLSTRLGKKGAMLLAQISVIVGYLSTWFLLTPSNPWFLLIPPLLMCPGLTTMWILSGSMMAEICDLDELKTGLRREAMFGAVFSLVFKAGFSSITILSGYLLVWAGIPENVENFIPPTTTLTTLRVLYIAIPTALLIVSSLLTWMFPITEKKAREVRAILDARKQESAEEPAPAI